MRDGSVDGGRKENSVTHREERVVACLDVSHLLAHQILERLPQDRLTKGGERPKRGICTLSKAAGTALKHVKGRTTPRSTSYIVCDHLQAERREGIVDEKQRPDREMGEGRSRTLGCGPNAFVTKHLDDDAVERQDAPKTAAIRCNCKSPERGISVRRTGERPMGGSLYIFRAATRLGV